VKEIAGIYKYDRRIDRILERIKYSSICEEDKRLLYQFHRECVISGLSKARITKYLGTLERIARWLNKPFLKVEKEDVMAFVQRIESNGYSEWTKHDYQLILKKFFKWLKKTDDYPEEVEWVSTRVKNNHMLPEEILTEDEVKKLVEAAYNLRDKAFILVLYESGCRIGEFLSLRLRNIQFDEYGAQLKDILHVMRVLGHKNINNTLIYTHLVDFQDDEYVPKVAHTAKEACKLVEAGFEFVCEINDANIFRKRK